MSSKHSFPKPCPPDHATPRSGVIAPVSSKHLFPKPVQPDPATPRSRVIAPVSSTHSFPKPIQEDRATPRSGVIAPVSSTPSLPNLCQPDHATPRSGVIAPVSPEPCVQNTVNVKGLGNLSTIFHAGISNQICFPYSSIGSPYSRLNPFSTVCIWENMMLFIAESLARPFSRMQTCLRWD